MGMRTALQRLLPSRRQSRQEPPTARGARLSLEMLERRELMSAGYYDPTFADGRATANFRDLLGSSATASPVPSSGKRAIRLVGKRELCAGERDGSK
jgi:hypothetical protein